ncbi:MAG: nitrate- and nitrite sensing domain-containing protein, partial [Pseudomonadota bacterium]
MKRLVDRLSIKELLLLSIVFPTLAYTVAAGNKIYTDIGQWRAYSYTQERGAIARKISAIIHFSQIERGNSEVQIRAGGNMAKLDAARTNTDDAIGELTQTMKQASLTGAEVVELEMLLGKYAEIRRDVSVGSPAEEVVGNYNGLIKDFLHIVLGYSRKTTDLELKEELYSLFVLEKGK